MKDGTDRSASIRPIGSWLLRLLASMGIVMAILSCQTPIAFAAECGGWTPVDGERDFVPAYPDTHAQYWVWSFARTRISMTTAFRIKGQFPYARYMSFQTYSSTQGDALQDFQIVPDSGSVNPFQPQIDRSAVTRSYTVWFVPPNSTQHQNSIEMPSNTSAPNLVLRIVRADQDKPDGGVPLPTIEAFDDRTGQPNVVNGYLAARLADPGEGTLAALRFTLPSFPNTYNQPGTAFTGREDVRYMGLCVHGAVSTLTSECFCDDELQLTPGSHDIVKVVVGPEDSSVRAAALARGYHYLSWKNLNEPLLVYRQLLPHADFSGSVGLVPVYDPKVDHAEQRAESFLGAYAPTGVVCKVSTFMENASACGLP